MQNPKVWFISLSLDLTLRQAGGTDVQAVEWIQEKRKEDQNKAAVDLQRS